MKIGITLRNMGPQSAAETLLACASAAEDAGVDSLWITDHIAIPPDDAEGSGGRYLDPLLTLGVIAGATSRIGLGTGVLILPYRPPLPTAKQVATLQELSGHRLLLGVGVGWMDAEFRALGIDRHRRGRDTDRVLEFLRRCFDATGASDSVVEANGQSFLFKPNPPAPPIYIGGRAPHALARAVRHGAGWLPMGGEPDALAEDLAAFSQYAAAQGVNRGPVTVMRGLPLGDADECRSLLARYEDLGVERLVCAVRYEGVADYRRRLDELVRCL